LNEETLGVDENLKKGLTMKKCLTLLVLTLFFVNAVFAVELDPLPDDPYFSAFKPYKTPAREGAVLHRGDRVAICGDSITEQKMYSRIMETYLTVCVPQLEVTVRQFGWSGERAPGFYGRMANDVLRFDPTLATTCYGMNDHLYRSYTEEIGRVYRDNALAIIKDYTRQGVRVIQGSSGTVGKMPSWVKTAQGTVKDLNLCLLELRNIDVALAQQEQVVFADVYLPMLVQGFYAQQKYGKDYMISGKDGVHPGWAGQVVMAYAFLEAMGLEGDIARIHLDARTQKATASANHEILSVRDNTVTLDSRAYPFCATGPEADDGSLRSGMSLVPFNERLNRFTLVVSHLSPGQYKVFWGDAVNTYTADVLAQGVNLAADYHVNPFTEAFKRVDNAVAQKQSYETRQVKTLFHGPEGRADMAATVALTEKTRAPLVKAITRAFKPVKHTIRIVSVR
jgi:hypothetical protein